MADARWCTPPGVAFAFVEHESRNSRKLGYWETTLAVPADVPADVPASLVGSNVLREDLPLPVCVLRAAALERNLARFSASAKSGAGG